MYKKGDLDIITLKTKYSTMELTPFGAHVLSFKPNGHSDIFWMGLRNSFSNKKAIRGGVPVCWPRFGDEALHTSLPKHGFARLQEWQVDNINEGNEESSITLSLQQNSHWASIYLIKAKLTVVIGQNLNMILETTNTGTEAFSYSEALHSYFKVGDIDSIAISGLAGSSYYDKVDGDNLKHLEGDFIFSKLEDTIFANNSSTAYIVDRAMARKIIIKKSGSKSTVLWNPYQKDVGDEVVGNDYKGFVCVEAGNVKENAIVLEAGQSHSLSMQIDVEFIEK